MNAAIFRTCRSAFLAVFALPAICWSQPYVTADLGYANADFSLDEPYNGVVDDGAITYGLNFGFGFNRYLAAEVGLHGYGNFDGRATPCPAGQACPQVVEQTEGNDISSYTVAVVPRITLENVEVFGKAGFYRARLETNTSLGGFNFNERGAVLGAGARWYFDEPWSVSVQASRFDDNLYRFAVGVGWGLQWPTSN